MQTPSFADAAANATGKDASSNSRASARAKALGDELNDIAGTSLDAGVKLDAPD